MPTREQVPAAQKLAGGSALEVLAVFLRLGLSSFGGPVAHLGYFREEFVHRRRWLDDKSFADLVGLCQFLPGPASSQVGIAVGLVRASYVGAVAAWIGFTRRAVVVGTDRRHRSRRRGRRAVVARQWAGCAAGFAAARQPKNRRGAPGAFLHTADRIAVGRRCGPVAGAQAVRRLLPRRLAGVRRRA